MYPYIHLGNFSIGTFGILLWLAAVCACWALYANFQRWKIEADAIGIVAIATVAGVVGAKLWHVLEDPQTLIHHPFATIFDRAGFAWFGGLVVGIIALLWQGRTMVSASCACWICVRFPRLSDTGWGGWAV